MVFGFFYTRASPHMTGNLRCLSQVKNVDPMPIELSDGVFPIAKLQGSLDLWPNIKLNNVLYIPNFHCNLVSITQLSI